jgi:nitrate reductase NapAB chaperone NapD
MSDRPRPAMLHISSAVVMAWPRDCGRIIVVMEGPDSGTIGGRLAEIALIDGVLSANLVFEHAESLDTREQSE